MKNHFSVFEKISLKKTDANNMSVEKKKNLDRLYIFQPPKMQQAHNRCSKSIKYDKGAFHLIFTSSNRDVP